MPIYVYEVVLEGEDAGMGMRFELFQKFSDAPLTVHPVTGQPVRRVITDVHTMGQWSETKMNAATADANLSRHGIGKYERQEDGSYRKIAGHGEDTIRRKPCGHAGTCDC